MTHGEQIRAAIESPQFSHARWRMWCGQECVYIYHRQPDSPSGVHLVISGHPSEVDPILREVRNTSPLSPTEGL